MKIQVLDSILNINQINITRIQNTNYLKKSYSQQFQFVYTLLKLVSYSN